MNTRRVAALLRELADELERDDAPAEAPANDTRHLRREGRATAEGVERAAEALRRRGVYPPERS